MGNPGHSALSMTSEDLGGSGDSTLDLRRFDARGVLVTVLTRLLLLSRAREQRVCRLKDTDLMWFACKHLDRRDAVAAYPLTILHLLMML